MASGKWIGALFGFVFGHGIFGALSGFCIGSLFDSLFSSLSHSDSNRPETVSHDSFLLSLMILAAHVIQVDGRIMHSEMEFVRRFLRNNFGETGLRNGEQMILQIFKQRKQMTDGEWNDKIVRTCRRLSSAMNEEYRLQLLAFLCELVKVDGNVTKVETDTMKQLAAAMGLSASVIDQFLHLGGNSLEEAYKVLGITPDASDDEVRKAYRKMALQHHPDRVATLGEDVQKAAQKKFQEITEAKDRIFQARGIS